MRTDVPRETSPRILCVDDEPRVLQGLQRTLRRCAEVIAAVGGEEGIRTLDEKGPFVAVLSDMRMPGVDGMALLSHARAHHPDTTRVLLTGHADLDSAIAAVNEGAVFRFLTKPCAPDVLMRAIAAAAEQHRLVTTERTLLEDTLHGSIRALIDVLALINPSEFGRATRARSMAGAFASRLGYEPRWQIEVAAMLSQIGTVSLPRDTIDKLNSGSPLTYAESVNVQRLPRIASEIVSRIPRLEPIRDMLLRQGVRFDGADCGPRDPASEGVTRGARLLRLVLDLDLLESQGMARHEALETLRGREGWYDPVLLDALAEFCGEGEPPVLDIELRAVRPGMVFAEDVRTASGQLLIARGQAVTDRLAERIENLQHLVEARQVVRVTSRAPAGPSPDAFGARAL